MGNKQSDVGVAIELDKEFYFAGETVNGTLHLNAKKKYPCARIMLHIKGVEACDFAHEGSDVRQTVTKSLVDCSYIVQDYGPKNALLGQYSFPFSFKFMDYLPGTFKESQGKIYDASIKYTLKAVIQSSGGKPNIEKDTQIVIRQPQKEEGRMLYGQTYPTVSNCCFQKGVSFIATYFERNYYFPSEQCIIICEIDNLKCQTALNTVKCRFIKELTLTSTHGNSRTFTRQMNRIEFEGVAAKESRMEQQAQRQTIPLTSGNQNKPLAPTTSGRYVRCNYYVIVEPAFSGCCTSTRDGSFRVELKILQPPMHYEPIVPPSDWQPRLSSPSFIYLEEGSQHRNDLISSMDTKENFIYAP